MSAHPLIDRDHLAAQTFGDADLAREVLGLFVEQCRRLVPAIAEAGRPAGERADLAHTLKGAALGIGAVRVAALAGIVEARLRGEGDPEAPARDLAAAAAETVALIAAETGPAGG